MSRGFRTLLTGLALGLTSFSAVGQDSDFCSWFGFSVEKQVTRRLALSVSPQLRLNRNLETIDQFFLEGSGQYLISNNFRASLSYRFSQSNRIDYYSTRHRLFLDLSYRTKVGNFQFVLRERIQSQLRDIYSSDLGRFPAWYLRTRLAVRYDLDRPWRPYVSTEVFYRARDVRNPGRDFDQVRYETGVDYTFNRRHAVNVFFMLRRNPEETVIRDAYITGAGYTLSF